MLDSHHRDALVEGQNNFMESKKEQLTLLSL